MTKTFDQFSAAQTWPEDPSPHGTFSSTRCCITLLSRQDKFPVTDRRGSRDVEHWALTGRGDSGNSQAKRGNDLLSSRHFLLRRQLYKVLMTTLSAAL